MITSKRIRQENNMQPMRIGLFWKSLNQPQMISFARVLKRRFSFDKSDVK